MARDLGSSKLEVDSLFVNMEIIALAKWWDMNNCGILYTSLFQPVQCNIHQVQVHTNG